MNSTSQSPKQFMKSPSRPKSIPAQPRQNQTPSPQRRGYPHPLAPPTSPAGSSPRRPRAALPGPTTSPIGERRFGGRSGAGAGAERAAPNPGTAISPAPGAPGLGRPGHGPAVPVSERVGVRSGRGAEPGSGAAGGGGPGGPAPADPGLRQRPGLGEARGERGEAAELCPDLGVRVLRIPPCRDRPSSLMGGSLAARRR